MLIKEEGGFGLGRQCQRRCRAMTFKRTGSALLQRPPLAQKLAKIVGQSILRILYSTKSRGRAKTPKQYHPASIYIYIVICSVRATRLKTSFRHSYRYTCIPTLTVRIRSLVYLGNTHNIIYNQVYRSLINIITFLKLGSPITSFPSLILA